MRKIWQKTWLIGTLSAIALVGCGQGEGSYEPAETEVGMMDMMSPVAAPPPPADGYQKARFQQEMEDVVEELPDGNPAPDPDAAPDPASSRLIAYTYQWGFKVPTGNLEALMSNHKLACEAVGVARCYVENSNVSGLGEDYANGYLRIRAATDWVDTFKAGLSESLQPFDASLDASNQSAEDLTTQIIDTTATLNSRKTLRDRLQKLLAVRPGKLSDLLEIEREMARVQQQIDSTESILAAMRQRVSMSVITLNYEARYSAASESIWRPLGDAFSDFIENVVRSLAGLVNLVSNLLIWILLLGGLGWFVITRLRRRGKKAKPASEPKTPIAPQS